MNSRLIPIVALIASGLSMGLSTAAHAAPDMEFDFSNGLGTRSGSGSSMQYYLDGNQSGSGMGVSITGWQANSTNSNFINRTRNLKNFGNVGFGLDKSESGWQEAFDNRGKYDLVIFEFDQAVSLDRIDFGWVGNDWDVTVLAHTGPTSPTLGNNRFRYNQNSSKGMTNLGWELVGHHANNTTSPGVSAGVTSSFWAIGAYTSAITDSSRTYGLPDTGDDYFTLKRLAVSAAGVAVSEPSMLALMLFGFLLLTRRRFANR